MYQHTRLNSNRFSFFQKFKNLDYLLLFCILLLGFISLTTMYSTDGGQIYFIQKPFYQISNFYCNDVNDFTDKYKILVFSRLPFLFIHYRILLWTYFWDQIICLKDDGLIFYKSSTLRINEDMYHNMLS